MDKGKNIFIAFPLEEQHLARLVACAPGWDVTYVPEGLSDAQLEAADAILGSLSAEKIKQAKRLRWVQIPRAGLDNLIEAGVFRPGLDITNITGAFGQAISEYMLTYLLMLYKKMHLYRDNQKQNLWKGEGQVLSHVGKTVLCVGMGDIGGDFAKLMHILGAYVIGIRRTNGRKPDYLDELYMHDQLDAVLPRADVVALSLPATADTAGLFDSARIARMKDGAVLINVGRGTAVDTEALCDALESGKLMGAAVDVTDPEPLPGDHRLWSIPNAIVTPHITGSRNLYQSYLATVDIFAENLTRFVNGRELLNIVDPDTGYRKLENAWKE